MQMAIRYLPFGFPGMILVALTNVLTNGVSLFSALAVSLTFYFLANAAQVTLWEMLLDAILIALVWMISLLANPLETCCTLMDTEKIFILQLVVNGLGTVKSFIQRPSNKAIKME